MELAERNICVLAIATAYGPDDCYFCGRSPELHLTQGQYCPGEFPPRQPRRRYQAIGWQDYATLGLQLGCYYSYQTARYTWFDPLSLSGTIDALIAQAPLLVSYQGASFAGPLLWEVWREGPDGATAHALNGSLLLAMHHAWVDLWNRSYDLLDAILAACPDVRAVRQGVTLDQVCAQTLQHTRQMSAFLFANLWSKGHYGQALTALQFDLWLVKALLERICNRQVLLVGNGDALTLALPPELETSG